jgi:hypothetical protein
MWHFDCSLDFFNFSLRGTKIHPKKPAFLRPIKSFIFLKYMPRLHLLPSIISKFSGPPTNQEGVRYVPPLMPTALGDIHVECPVVSAYFQKFSIYLKKLFENPDDVDNDDNRHQMITISHFGSDELIIELSMLIL